MCCKFNHLPLIVSRSCYCTLWTPTQHFRKSRILFVFCLYPLRLLYASIYLIKLKMETLLCETLILLLLLSYLATTNTYFSKYRTIAVHLWIVYEDMVMLLNRYNSWYRDANVFLIYFPLLFQQYLQIKLFPISSCWNT